jgi:hypothetical protein
LGGFAISRMLTLLDLLIIIVVDANPIANEARAASSTLVLSSDAPEKA